MLPEENNNLRKQDMLRTTELEIGSAQKDFCFLVDPNYSVSLCDAVNFMYGFSKEDRLYVNQSVSKLLIVWIFVDIENSQWKYIKKDYTITIYKSYLSKKICAFQNSQLDKQDRLHHQTHRQTTTVTPAGVASKKKKWSLPTINFSTRRKYYRKRKCDSH